MTVFQWVFIKFMEVASVSPDWEYFLPSSPQILRSPQNTSEKKNVDGWFYQVSLAVITKWNFHIQRQYTSEWWDTGAKPEGMAIIFVYELPRSILLAGC